MSINPDKQYSTIENALKEGHRLAWKEGEGFKDITRKEVSEYQKLGYTTDLLTLKNEISKFIEKHLISDTQKKHLESAFENRAKNLKGRFVLFKRAKRDQAVDKLTQVKETISKKIAQETIFKDLHEKIDKAGEEINKLRLKTMSEKTIPTFYSNDPVNNFEAILNGLSLTDSRLIYNEDTNTFAVVSEKKISQFEKQGWKVDQKEVNDFINAFLNSRAFDNALNNKEIKLDQLLEFKKKLKNAPLLLQQIDEIIQEQLFKK